MEPQSRSIAGGEAERRPHKLSHDSIVLVLFFLVVGESNGGEQDNVRWVLEKNGNFTT